MFGLSKNRDHVTAATPVDELSTAGRLARREEQITDVNELTWSLLIAQTGRHDDRNSELVDALLDIRRVLDLPAPIGVPLVRPAVPVIPGVEGGSQ